MDGGPRVQKTKIFKELRGRLKHPKRHLVRHLQTDNKNPDPRRVFPPFCFTIVIIIFFPYVIRSKGVLVSRSTNDEFYVRIL